jgi:hypothetical protein
MASRLVRGIAALGLLAVVAVTAHAQSTTGRISGTVKDTQGGILPGAAVTVTETTTGFVRTTVTDGTGNYVFVSLPLGSYSVSAEMSGFKKALKSGYTLTADGRLTADLLMEVGGISEVVEVTVKGETVNMTSGEVARTVDQSQVQDMALNGRNYMQLATLIPGAPMLSDDALGIMTGLAINTSINGSRTNYNVLTVDGGFNQDGGSNNSIISNVGIDFIEEVSIKTSNFSAEYGRASGAAINIVSRRGTNKIRGSVFEYNRNEAYDANDYFANMKGVPRAELKYNDYGFSLGGPIQKDKLFFFAGMEWKKIRRLTASTFRTLPNSAYRSGDFSALSTRLIDPTTGQQFPGNIIPASRITADGKAVAAVYAAMSQQAVSYADTPTSNNALFQDPNPFDYRQEFVRLDYQASGHHRLTARLFLDHYDLIEPGGTFISSQLPTVPTNRKRPGRNIQLNHFWTPTSTVVNELKLNYSGNGQKIPPVGDTWKRETYGFQFPQLYAGGGEYENSIPNVDMTGFATFRGANASLLSPTWDYALSDNVTWTRGRHTLKGGAQVFYNTKDQNGRSEYPGYVNFATSGNTRTTGNAFADALLGNFRTYREAQLDPIGYYRYWHAEAFVSDQWRVAKDLSIEAGIRYTLQSPTVTLGNNVASFNPSLYNPAQAVTLDRTTGNLVGTGGNRYNGLTRPGDIPSDQKANIPNADSPLIAAIPIAENRGFYPTYNLFMPRVSFSWSPGGSATTAIRGGIGLFYDLPEGNLYFPLANVPPYNLSSEYQNGNLANPGGGTAAAVAPWGTIDSIDPNLKIPRVWNFSLGVQRELGFWGLFGEIGYVGNRGQQMTRQPDINMQSFADLAANQLLPSAQRASTNYLRPYKGFTAINMRLSDARSQYDSLQVFLGKRRGDLKFTLNYTLGKAMDNASGNGDALETGVEFGNADYNWGPAGHDRRHIFVATWSYRLPFFKNDKGATGNILGGWEVSGITRFQTGAPFSVTGTTSIGGRRADLVSGADPYVAEGSRVNDGTGVVQWLNPASFAVAPDSRPGNTGRNQFRGPGYQVWDISLRKQFKVSRDVRVQVEASMFNAFNTVNWSNPATNFSGSGFGQITATSRPRNMQLGARLTF